MSRVDDTVKDSIGYCRITNHVIPVGCGVLRGYDDGFPFMPVFNNFKQYGTFFGIKRHEEQVIEDEQLTAFNLLEFRFKYPFDFCHFQCAKQFRCIGVESPEPSFTRFVTKGARQITFPRTGRTGYEKILPFMHKVKGSEAFHLIAVQSPVYGIVNLFNIGLVTE